MGSVSDSVMPVPVADADSALYWQGANEGRFMFQRCKHCGRAQFYSRSLCSTCQSRELAWEQSKGEGRIASFSVVHRAPIPAFKSQVPYVLALVDLDEGIRFMCNVLNCDPVSVRIGNRVKVVYQERSGSAQRVPQVELQS